MSPLTEQLVRHDLDDTTALLDIAKGVADEELRAVRQPGLVVLSWDGPEESIQRVLEHHLFTKQCWLAAIDGGDMPEHDEDADAVALAERHDEIAPRWLETVRDINRRGAWDDLLIDAICDPPESFVLSSVVAHTLTFGAHRRQLVRRMLAQAGVDVDHGDPIMWLRAQRGEES